MKRTQGRNEACQDSKHLFCQPWLTCSNPTNGGSCYDNSPSQPEEFLARGETCQTPNDCVSGDCDPFINKCVNSNIDVTSGEARCGGWYDCQWGEYCSPADTTTTPNIPATCKPVPGGFGSRSGALCKSQTPDYYNYYTGYITGQCGHAQFCMQKNYDESIAQHTAYILSTCQKPYSIPEGEMCYPDIPAGYVQIGATWTDFPISFCANGPCVRSGPNLGAGINGGEYRCVSADYTYAGTGCQAATDCGRGLDCLCPPGGGSRQRCMLNTGSGSFQQWEGGRHEWFSKTQPWLQCLDDNQCTLNDADLGSCGNRHCSGFDQSQDSHTCNTDQTWFNVPNYKGYHDTISAASFAVVSVKMWGLILLALLYAVFQL
jgi:hypothetical protein